MNKLRSIGLSCTLLLLIAASNAHGQTAEEIVAKHIAAMGGKEKIQSVHSLYLEGVAVMQNGTEIDIKSWKIKDKLYRQEISFGMGSVVIIVTPQKGWSLNPRSGSSNFTPMTEEQVKALQPQMDPSDPLVDYAAQGSKMEWQGKDTVGGKECYKIRLTPATGQAVTYSIDAQSSYVLRETHKGGMFGGGGRRGANANGEINIDFGDYQKTADGYIFPYTILTGNLGAKMNVEKLEVNKDVDVAALSKPSN